MAAAAATVALHPLDTVKTVLQGGGGAVGAGGLAAVRSLGVGGLYRGVAPAAFSMMPACAVRMGTYEVLKGVLLRSTSVGLPASVSVFFASACSVVVSVSVRAPLDMIKTKVQADSTMGAAAACRMAWGTGGRAAVARLYNGAGLALVRDVPFFGLNLLIYEQLKAVALQRAMARALAPSSSSDARKAVASKLGEGCSSPAPPPKAVLSPRELLLIGFAAQGIAGFLTNPADALKTRVQSGAASSMGAALQAALKEGGPAVLMRGACMRVVWIAPQGCIYYPVYEWAQNLLGR